jgi:predicted  nucleic acid-binding Zn-ribbon protein
MRSISSIETEIKKVEADLAKAQEKCDALSARLLELQKMKQDIEAKKVMDAFRKSGKSMQELMTFLDV